jgi:hypothetical protein
LNTRARIPQFPELLSAHYDTFMKFRAMAMQVVFGHFIDGQHENAAAETARLHHSAQWNSSSVAAGGASAAGNGAGDLVTSQYLARATAGPPHS